MLKASLEAPIVADDRVIVPKGTDGYVKLVNASSAGKRKVPQRTHPGYAKHHFPGQTYHARTSDVKQKRSAGTIGGGAVLGALFGGLAGGDKGAAVGAAVGGGAGTGVQVFTKGQADKDPL